MTRHETERNDAFHSVINDLLLEMGIDRDQPLSDDDTARLADFMNTEFVPIWESFHGPLGESA